MQVEEKKLRIFLRVAKSDSLHDAAKSLGMSVSSVSRILAALEKEVGLALFDRSGYRLTLTDDGLAYFQQAREIVASMQELSHFKERRKLYSKRILHIASFPRQAETLLVPAVKEISALLPQFQICLDVHISRDFWQSRYLHPFDIGFGNLKDLPKNDLVVLPLGVSSLVVCVPENNPLSEKKTLTPKDLTEEQFILLASDTLVGSTVGQIFPFISSRQVAAFCSSTPSALAMVSLGMGIHITDSLGAQSSSLKNARVIPLVSGNSSIISGFWPKETFVPANVIKVCCDVVTGVMQQKGLRVLR